WHRGKVLEKRQNICETFVIDTGQVLVVEERHIASACDEFFQLPPKVVLGIFANILPLEKKWGPKAINYFSSLVGLQIKGQVKAVTSYQLFVLEVPKIISDTLDLQLGKLIDGDSFCLIVEMLRAFPQEMVKVVPELLQQKCPVQELLTFSNSEKSSDFWPVPDGLFPCLPVGSRVNVKITVAVSPSQFYCQIQKWQKELEKLTEAMSLYYEAISTKSNALFDSLGLLCAARRKNGQWHRGVVKQVLPDHVEVWFMDFGNTEAVPSSCVQKLQVEFMSLPMISFPCALSCFGNQDEAVIKHQLKKLIHALAGQNSVCVDVDLFSASKHLYYVTLPNQNLGINAEHSENLNEAVALCVSPLETKITRIDGSCKARAESYSSSEYCAESKQAKPCLPKWDRCLPSHCKRVEMQMNTSYTAFVVYVINPSNFWIQTCEYQNEFQALMKNIADVYSQCGADERVLKNPEPGSLCCARYYKDACFYRGVVTEVLHVGVTVYFLDFGNTDIVPFNDVKTLLPEFSDLPALAMCCELGCAFPVEDVWVKKETDFFKEIVFDKQLLFQVIGKQSNKYIVNAQYRGASQGSSVATLMVQAGFAEYWERSPGSALNLAKKCQTQNSRRFTKKYVRVQHTSKMRRNNASQNRQILQKEKTLSMPSVQRKFIAPSSFGKDAVSESHKSEPEKKVFYKEFVFEPGAVFEVVCSYSVSPADFSCQLQSKLPELNTLMKRIQAYYRDHTRPYKMGQVACVVKCPKDGKWYRANVVQQVSTSQVDVVFVDYGYQERVLLDDLQAVLPDFLTLESQAFQCALRNAPLQTDAFHWPEEVCRHFRDFVSASGGPLICTICALFLLRPNSLCNVVDLQTPCMSTEEFLRGWDLNQSEYLELQRLAPSGSLYSFCYSTFNLKAGSEEEVYITHVHSPSKFYCQLNRNTETVEALKRKVSEISKIADHAKYDASSTPLCIARYFEDGLFYRALVFPVESTSYLCADFVDFGNKHMIERDQLMPIPDSATDLLFTPMQAIKCCLSEFRERKVPARVVKWFEETFLDKMLKAVIVSRESDGQIVVELYDGHLQVGQKIKEKIVEEAAIARNYTEQFVQSSGLNFGDEEPAACNTHKLHSESSELLTCEDSEEPGFQKTVGTVLEHREKPLDGKPPSGSLCHPPNLNEITINAQYRIQSEQLNCAGQQERSNENMPKLISLPQNDIQVNSEVAAYISHINSPSSFYIHFAEDENLIIQLGDELNESVLNMHHENGLDELMVGNLILAEHTTDCFYYRAVIKALKSGNSFEVEFIDYGNTAVVSPSKICRIEEKFLTLPRLSIHCSLSRVKNYPDESWTVENTSDFISKVDGKPVTCKFIEQHGEQWEVDIIYVLIGEVLLQEYLNKLLSCRQTFVGWEKYSNTDCKEFSKSFKMSSITWTLLQSGRRYSGFATAVTDPSDFCVQFEELFGCMNNLSSLLSEIPGNLQALPEEFVAPGTSCLIQFGLEAQWNRAEISEVTSQSVILRWIDYGFLNSIPYTDIHKLKVMPEGLSYLPHLACSCSLHGV
ncbi:TDR15 protein, partial [Alectura lathami]|nr:TDR15 protein [Alectura lathami]